MQNITVDVTIIAKTNKPATKKRLRRFCDFNFNFNLESFNLTCQP